MKKIFILTLAALPLFAAAQVPSYVPTNGLVGWWPFNGNANDESGNGNNGTVTGATLVSDRFGNNSSAYFFNYTHWSWGSGGDEIYVPYSSTLAPTNITVSVWAYRTSSGYPNQSFNIVNRFEQGYNNPNGQTWGIGAGADPNTTIYTVVYQAAPNNSQAYLLNNGPNLGLNTWTNIVMTFDGLALKQFINGILIDSVSANGLTINTAGTSGISIGVSDQANGHWHPFDGKIDDIGIWNRALTSQEISALYNGCGNSITAQPSNQSIAIGNSAVFATNSSDPNATYQWQTNLGLGWQNVFNAGQYSGVTTNTLNVNSVNAGNNNQAFRCIVSSGSCTDTTSAAYITITTGITENTSSTFTIFPNPANNTITVSWSQPNIQTLTLTDAAGRAVRTYNVTGTQAQLSLEGLASGVYFLSGDGEEKVVQKIIKQ